MDKYREICAILSGRVTFVNGAYSAASSMLKSRLMGSFNGGDAVRIFGINRMVRYYQSESVDVTVYMAKAIFGKLGRSVYFQSDPKQQACFLRSYLGNPVILTLEETNDGVRVDAYTARTLLSGMNLRHAFKVFEKQLPDDMQVELLHSEEEKRRKVPKMQESRKVRRAKKKAEKLEKRAQRINDKAQAASQAANQENGNNR